MIDWSKQLILQSNEKENKMSNVYDLANELNRTIRQLPEYQAALEAKKAIDADPKAKQLLADYLAFQVNLQAILQAGQMPGESYQKQLEDFASKIQAQPALSNFFAKQQQLGIYMADIEKLIIEPMQDLLKP